MNIEKFIANVWYKQKLILIDDYCNTIISATAEQLWRKGNHLMARKIDVFQANNKGEIVITLKRSKY